MMMTSTGLVQSVVKGWLLSKMQVIPGAERSWRLLTAGVPITLQLQDDGIMVDLVTADLRRRAVQPDRAELGAGDDDRSEDPDFGNRRKWRVRVGMGDVKPGHELRPDRKTHLRVVIRGRELEGG
jgi:hypothetical protein